MPPDLRIDLHQVGWRFHDQGDPRNAPGVYWQAQDGGREYGPYATLLEAVQDMQTSGEGELEPGETLAEAEGEIGIADYADPETGEPAEERGPRLEDH